MTSPLNVDHVLEPHHNPPLVRRLIIGLLLAVGGVVEGEQAPADAKLVEQFTRLFPAATSFSPKAASPPHFKAFKRDPRAVDEVIGVAFWTTELEPLERAYDGPIKILVGMNMTGVLTGIIVVQHHEPYGDFSIEPPAFAAQFAGKSIRDPFRVGDDIDAVSRASITITSATRVIKNSARRVARQLLTP
jgi:NosR/NirI family nitrous oxide reductase transcriptional regulator